MKQVPKYPIDAAILALDPTADVPLRSFGRSKLCCFWHDDTVASASIDWDTERYHCYGCPLSGDALALIMEVKEVDFVGALAWAEEEVGRGSTDVPRPAKRKRSRGLF